MYKDYLILGGAGLVGLQVCRHIVRRLEPTRIIVASLFEHEAEAAVSRLEAEFGNKVAFVPASGNSFVPSDLAKKSRAELRGDPELRRRLLTALYDDFETAYKQNHLAKIIKRHRPDVIVDCVNTATGLSYQDVFDGATKVREWISTRASTTRASRTSRRCCSASRHPRSSDTYASCIARPPSTQPRCT